MTIDHETVRNVLVTTSRDIADTCVRCTVYTTDTGYVIDDNSRNSESTDCVPKLSIFFQSTEWVRNKESRKCVPRKKKMFFHVALVSFETIFLKISLQISAKKCLLNYFNAKNIIYVSIHVAKKRTKYSPAVLFFRFFVVFSQNH